MCLDVERGVCSMMHIHITNYESVCITKKLLIHSHNNKIKFQVLLERNSIVSEKEPFQKTELRWVAIADTLTITSNLVVFSVFGCTRSKPLERSHGHCPIEVSLPFQFNRFHAVVGSVVR